MHKINDAFRPLSDITRDLRRAFSVNNLSQLEAAKACSLNQSQVSRLLSGRCVKLTKGMQKLCIYASINVHKSNSYDPANDASLMGALRVAIGSNPSRARQIERIMQALAEEQ
jgi:predicted XRE-type DNA-binding protein